MADWLVVGAGLAGCVLAERIANVLDEKVLLIDRRDHIAGNAYDFRNEHGLFVQKYGPHIFHTSVESVWDYLSQFTTWNTYVHRVLARVTGREIPLPIGIETMERLYDRTFTPEQLRECFEQRRIKLPRIENARDVVVSQVGMELYELLYKNYTRKQWGLDPEQLDPQVTGRLPIRFDRDTRYFADPRQGLPSEGYTRMFERMLDSANIEVRLSTEYRDVAGNAFPAGRVFTGPIDEFFDFRYGRLPYRSVRFRFQTLSVEGFQNAGVVNYPNEQDYTRITEFKHLYLQQHPHSAICYEYGCTEGPPCYPVPTQANRALYERYKALADTLDDVHFVGRLAQYEYLNMDQVVCRALGLFGKIRDRA